MAMFTSNLLVYQRVYINNIPLNHYQIHILFHIYHIDIIENIKSHGIFHIKSILSL